MYIFLEEFLGKEFGKMTICEFLHRSLQSLCALGHANVVLLSLIPANIILDFDDLLSVC